MLKTNIVEINSTLPADLPPESHLSAIAEILAVAVLRGRARRHISSLPNITENSQGTRGEGLALFGKQSAHG